MKGRSAGTSRERASARPLHARTEGEDIRASEEGASQPVESTPTTPHRPTTLRKLGEADSVLDGLVRLVGLEWRRFQERRDAEALLCFVEAVETVRTQLRVLHTLFERSERAETAGRALGPLGGSEAPGRSLEAELARSLERAEAIRARVRGEVPRGEPDPSSGDRPDGDADGGREPEEGGGGVTAGGGATAAGGRAAPPSGDGVAESSQAIESLLSRIRTDWEHYRRRPSSEQVGVLAGEVRQALELLDGLAESLGLPGPGAGERLGWVPEPGAVPFPPYRDQVTGLYSRQGFDASASADLKRCRRYERPFSLLMVELVIGDLASLRTAAAQARRTVRESDLLGRHVGQILAFGLSETDGDGARAVAARVVRALESVDAWSSGSRLSVASHPRDGETILALLELARDRLDGTDAELADVGGAGGAPAS